MSEHEPTQGERRRARPGHAAERRGADHPDHDPQATAEASEAELIRKVMRAQELHREGGVDPELDEDAADQAGQGGGG